MEPGETIEIGALRDRAAAHAGPHRGDAVAARRRDRRVHRRHAVQGLGRRRARARAHHLRRPEDLDHGQAAGAAAADASSTPATPTRRRSPRSGSPTRSSASGAGSTPRATSRAPRSASRRRSILLGDDYDGGHKAWVRWPDGSDDIVPGSQVQRGCEPRRDARSSCSRGARSDKIPTSRVRRTATVGRARRRRGRQAGRHARGQRRRAPRRAARRRSSAASSRPPSRSSPRWGR